MRSTARVLVVGILFASGAQTLAAESGSRWWPFGHHDQDKVAPPPAAAAPARHRC